MFTQKRGYKSSRRPPPLFESFSTSIGRHMKTILKVILLFLIVFTINPQAQDVQQLLALSEQLEEAKKTPTNVAVAPPENTLQGEKKTDPKKLSTIEALFHERLNTEHTDYYTIHKEMLFESKDKDYFNYRKKQALKSEKKELTNEELELAVRQFGYNTFGKTKQSRVQDNNIPVGDDYVLGPGDSLIIRIWGKLEQTFEVSIEKDGTIYIPKIGNIPLTGVKFGDTNTVIKKALERHFVNIQISVSMNRLKSIQVFVLGQATHPGAYNISSLSTLFMTLYNAGGPTKIGSLRNIQLKRGNTVVKTIDLYKYLLSGNSHQDPSLNAYDTIFIPPIGDVVLIAGLVKTPGIFEIKQRTSAYDAIVAMAGGIHANANKKHIQIERIQDGESIIVLDLEFKSSTEAEKELKKFALQNGDMLRVFSIKGDQKNTITINGNVYQPGTYQLKENMTLQDLINTAKGSKTNTFSKRVEIFRFISEDQRTVSFVDISTEKGKSFVLQDKDIVNLLSKSNALGRKLVSIEGAVQLPGNYQLLTDMRLSDIVFLAKTARNAELGSAELFRKNINGDEQLFTFKLKDILSGANADADILLKEHDKIHIKTTKAQSRLKRFHLSGEVQFPGTYLAKENETISDIIQRAGGLTHDAFLYGAEFKRQSTKKSEETGHIQVLDEEKKRLIYDQKRMSGLSAENQELYANAMQYLHDKIKNSEGRIILDMTDYDSFKKSHYNLKVEDGDTLHIPKPSQSVQVVGGVLRPTGVLYVNDKKSKYYIKQAGSYSEFAKKGRFYVLRANGSIDKKSKHVNEGDTIYIPEEIKIYSPWMKTVLEFTQVIFNVATAFKLTGII